MNVMGTNDYSCAKPVPNGTVRVNLHGLVYFASDGEFIKIGYSGAPVLRVRDLQVANARELTLLVSCAATEDEEKALHARFSSVRERGEWFRPCPEIDALIAALPSAKRAIKWGRTDILDVANKVLGPPPERRKITTPPTNADRFYDWASAISGKWPAEIQVQCYHAWQALLGRRPQTEHDKFMDLYTEWSDWWPAKAA